MFVSTSPKHNIPPLPPQILQSATFAKKTSRSLRARPLKSYRAPIGKARLPTTIFQGGAVQLQGAPTVAVGTLSWASTATKLGRRSDGLSSQVHYLNKGNGTGPRPLEVWNFQFGWYFFEGGDMNMRYALQNEFLFWLVIWWALVKSRG